MCSDLVRERSRDSCWHKAAILLAIVERRRAVAVLRGLEPAEVLNVAGEMALIRTADRREAETVLEEYGLDREAFPGGAGGMETVRELLAAAFGVQEGAMLCLRLEPMLRPAIELAAEPRLVAEALSRESASTAAAVLAKAEPGVAAELLSLLPVRSQIEIAGLMGRMSRLRPDALVRIGSALAAVIRTREDLPRTVDGRGALEAIVSSLPSAGRRRLLASLQEADPELFEANGLDGWGEG